MTSLPSPDPLVTAFLKAEKHKAQSNGIVFVLSPTERVPYFNRQCNGFFEAEMPFEGKVTPYMATAIGKPLEQWLMTFVHESSHMDQYLEKSPYWLPAAAYKVLDRWLTGEKFTDAQIHETITNVILMEADCEHRSMQKIKKFKLPIDLSAYAKNANSYLLFHHWMHKERLWYKTAPYEIEAILSEMDSMLKTVEDYLEPPPESVLKLFERCR